MFKVQGWQWSRFWPHVSFPPSSTSRIDEGVDSRKCISPKTPVQRAGLLVGAIATLLWAAMPGPSQAAETIAVSFKDLLEIEISVADLESFVLDGKLPRSIDGVAGLVGDQQLDSARDLLARQLDVEATIVSQFFSLPEGELVLNRIAQLLKESAGQDTITLLRQALFRAASDNQGLTLLRVVQQFPAETLAVDLDAVLRLVAENAELYSRRSTVFEQLWSQVQPPVETTPESLTRDLREPGVQVWDQQTIRFQNPSRVGSSPADLYLPKSPPQDRVSAITASFAPTTGKVPVIIISHGLGSNRQTFAYLARHFASYGFAVVVLEHTDTNTDRFSRLLNGVADPPPPTDLINRPRDISTVLDELARRAETEPELAQLDIENVGVLGQSLGGYTVLAAAGATIDRPRLASNCSRNFSEELTLNLSLPIQCRILDLPQGADLTVQDERVKAVLAINPLTSQILGPTGLNKIKVPVMMVASTDDYFAPSLAEQIEPFRWLSTSEKYLLVVKNATHFSFLDHPDPPSPGQQAFTLPAGLLGPNPEQARPLLQATSLAFFEQHLRMQSGFEEYLSKTYLTDTVEDPFSAAIVRSLSSLDE